MSMTRAIRIVVFSALAFTIVAAQAPRVEPPVFGLDEATIADLQQRMQSGQDTARSIAEKYLARIDAIDRSGPALHSVIETNPDALATADRLDAERKASGPRGPLHGIPVLLKDNIATADRMMTTAGSLALFGATPPKDAFIVERLRQAGAVILGKTNLSEWANFRSTHSTSGWSGRGGLTRNPYALDRNTSGSSSGSGAATAANLTAVAVGTETDGSIVSPSNVNGLVGIKPTIGLLSRAGIVPIAHSQDTAGPMARTVADAAALLGAMIGVDPDDPATRDSTTKSAPDYTMFLDKNGLKGARIGVVRNRLFGSNPAADAIAERAIAEMKRQGAVIVDPANIPTLGKFDDSEFDVLLYEFKADLDKYLSGLGPAAPVHSLQDVIAFNDSHAGGELQWFGQEIMAMAAKKGPLTDAKYVTELSKNHRLSRALGIDAVMTAHKLDALVAPTGGPAWLTDLVNGDSGTASTPGPSTITSVAGYPHITVPAGFFHGLPVGISFFGRAWSEPTLIKLAYAYEQATKHRRPPTFAATADLKP
ncbi:MAG: amidase [Vicinamibacterales bacterium]